MSVHNRNMKHARAIEFDYTNLCAMLSNYSMVLIRTWTVTDRPKTDLIIKEESKVEAVRVEVVSRGDNL